MKIGIIPDLQEAKTQWKEFVNKNTCDLYVFLCDLCDGYEVTDSQILNNIIEIIDFKKANPDKVVLLWGNHEMSYHKNISCSGYKNTMAGTLKVLFKDNQDLFKYAFQIGNHLFTHAGVHKDWYDNDFKLDMNRIEQKLNINLSDKNIAEQINFVANSEFNKSIFACGRSRGGFAQTGGILWVDKSEFWINSLIPNIHQYVGHSRVPSINNRFNIKGANESITFCDCLDTVTEFMEIEELKLT